MVINLSRAIRDAKEAGYWVAGTVVEGGDALDRVSFPFPLALVFGSEGKGLRHGILKHVDMRVTIPMRGARLSFNVAMACAILCYEVTRQREKMQDS